MLNPFAHKKVLERGVPGPSAANDLVDRLGRLAALHASGALTADAFAAQKQRVRGGG